MADKIVSEAISLVRNVRQDSSLYRLRPPRFASRVRGPVSFGTGNR